MAGRRSDRGVPRVGAQAPALREVLVPGVRGCRAGQHRQGAVDAGRLPADGPPSQRGGVERGWLSKTCRARTRAAEAADRAAAGLLGAIARGARGVPRRSRARRTDAGHGGPRRGGYTPAVQGHGLAPAATRAVPRSSLLPGGPVEVGRQPRGGLQRDRHIGNAPTGGAISGVSPTTTTGRRVADVPRGTGKVHQCRRQRERRGGDLGWRGCWRILAGAIDRPTPSGGRRKAGVAPLRRAGGGVPAAGHRDQPDGGRPGCAVRCCTATASDGSTSPASFVTGVESLNVPAPPEASTGRHGPGRSGVLFAGRAPTITVKPTRRTNRPRRPGEVATRPARRPLAEACRAADGTGRFRGQPAGRRRAGRGDAASVGTIARLRVRGRVRVAGGAGSPAEQANQVATLTATTGVRSPPARLLELRAQSPGKGASLVRRQGAGAGGHPGREVVPLAAPFG